MRPATWLAVLVVLAAFGGAAVVAVTGGFAGDGQALSTTWTSDSGVASSSNHHEVAVGAVGGRQVTFVPVSSTRSVDGCALVALDTTDGGEAWRDGIPAANCTIHAVADPAVADYDGDGTAEALATTTERVVRAYAPDGSVERTWTLSSYGYTKPVVADVTGDDAAEVVVVDAKGLVQVLDADGGVVWRVDREGFVWGTPVVADVDDDGAVEVVVAGSNGNATAYAADGSVDWTHDLGGAAVTWLTSADADDDGVTEFYAGTASGSVLAFDGTGERAWTTNRVDLSATAAVVADDRGPGVFVSAADGSVARLDADTGAVAWERSVARDAVQMMPPPVAGDVDGDGREELVVAANDGTVAVLASDDGRELAAISHDAAVLAAPTLVDVDGDGRDEVFVVFADGTVRRFDVDE